MKRLICSLLVVGSVLSARAQGLPPESFGGALWGAMLGGIIGSDCHQGFSGTGAAIGAGVGFVAGTIAGEARRNSGEFYPADTSVTISAGYSAYGSPYLYYAPNAYCAPGYYFRPAGPAFAVSKTVVTTGKSGGAAATGKPAAAAPSSEAGKASQGSDEQATAESGAEPQPAQSQPTARSSTSVFQTIAVTPRQIPDAPRVPDAPTF